MISALHLSNLTHSYPGFKLHIEELSLEEGSVVALAGHNGSGKSTLLNCIAGLLIPKAGTIVLSGSEKSNSDVEWKERVGYAGEGSAFFERWSVKKNLKLLSKVYAGWSHEWCHDLCARLDLDINKQVFALSRGNRMKLALISAMAYKPLLLLFDEPAEGLDPSVRAEMISVIRDLMSNEKQTILMATHHLDEFSTLLDEIHFLHEGKQTWSGTVDMLQDKWATINFRHDEQKFSFPGIVDIKSEGSYHRLVSSSCDDSIKELEQMGADDIQTSRIDLDEITKWMVRGGDDVASNPG